MSETKAILLCGSRLALPAMRDLCFHQQLAVVAIPVNCEDFLQEVQALLKSTNIVIISVSKNDYADQLQKAIKKYGVGIGIMIGFSYKLASSVYTLPAKGFFNVHPGPLPGYRGPDPIFRQIANREPYASATIHKVDNNFDTGQIVLSEKIPLLFTDTHGIVTSKLSELSARLVGILLKMCSFDMAIPSRVQDETKAVYYKRQSAPDISIDWQNMDAARIVALINACNPWNKGAVAKLNGRLIRLVSAMQIELPEVINKVAGMIVSFDENSVVISTIHQQAICVQIIYSEDGFMMASRLKELKVVTGMRFENV